MSSGKIQLILLGSAIIIGVLLFSARIKPDTTVIEQEIGLNEQIDSAVALVNGGVPMKGISMLLELAEKHPDNWRIHLNLGMFSLQSNQLEKAKSRFERVLDLQPKQAEALYFMGHLYVLDGDTSRAIEMMTSALNASEDGTLSDEINAYINELKN